MSLVTSILLVNFLLRQGQQHYTSLSAVLVLVSDQSHERKGLVSESLGLQDIVVLVQAKPTKERLCMVSESLALQKC